MLCCDRGKRYDRARNDRVCYDRARNDRVCYDMQ